VGRNGKGEEENRNLYEELRGDKIRSDQILGGDGMR
jgi:hypothetical protein